MTLLFAPAMHCFRVRLVDVKYAGSTTGSHDAEFMRPRRLLATDQRLVAGGVGPRLLG